MFKREITTLNLDTEPDERQTLWDAQKLDSTAKKPENSNLWNAEKFLDKNPERAEKIRETIDESQKDRADFFIKIASSRFKEAIKQKIEALNDPVIKDSALNFIPILGEIKTGLEALRGETRSGKKLTHFERALWATIPASFLAFGILYAIGNHSTAWDVRGVEAILAKLQVAFIAMSLGDIIGSLKESASRLQLESTAFFQILADEGKFLLNSINPNELKTSMTTLINKLSKKSKQ